MQKQALQLPDSLTKLIDRARPIYALSPHMDDVIWSMGGWLQSLARDGYEITLISIFTVSIYVYDDIRPPLEATAIRKSEDYSAARAAGFKNVLFLDFPDGILRDTPQTKVTNPNYRTPPYLLDLVRRSLGEILPKQATILAPAAFGGNMDHLTTRRAILQLPQPKILYTDMPYGTRSVNNDEAQQFLKQGWKHVTLPLSPTMIGDHSQLFWNYPSQTSMEVANEIMTQLTQDGLTLWVAAETA